MSSIPQNQKNVSTTVLITIAEFFANYKIGSLLRKANGNKLKGIPSVDIFRYLFSNIFENKSMYMQLATGSFKNSYSKNTVYRFLNSMKTNWLKFTTMLAALVIEKTLSPLTSEDRVNVFIIDDSTYERTGYKKTELASKIYDHAAHRYRYGYRMLTLGWSDGNTFIPVNSTLLASRNSENLMGPIVSCDKRSIAHRRRCLAQTAGTMAMLELLHEARANNLRADYVLFDTWFSAPAQLQAVEDCDLHAIAMAKKSSKIRYKFNDRICSSKEIFQSSKKRRGKSRYLLSVEVLTGPEHNIPAKLVFVRNRNNRKDWIVLISTDTKLTEDDIIRIYGKRWQIEMFFKTCKSMLKLTSECHSTSYDALTAHVAIVFARYILLALEQRKNTDDRTIGELFYLMIDEIEDITLAESMQLLMDAILVALKDCFALSDKQLNMLLLAFRQGLPKHILDTLNCTHVAA